MTPSSLPTRFLALAAAAVFVTLGGAGYSRANFLTTFTASGTNPVTGQAIAASATFQGTGSTLTVTLTNTSTADVLAPTDVLTSVFFSIAGNPLLTKGSAVLTSGSSVLFGTTDAGNVVGGEWAYLNGLTGSSPNGANSGISSSGYGVFGPGDVFPGTNLQGPASPDGLQYGITSAGDNSSTGNSAVTGDNALIQNSVTFTLTGLPTNLQASDISNVLFQYGTALTDVSIQGGVNPFVNTVPAPPSVYLLGFGGLGLLAWSFRPSRRLTVA